MTTSRLAVLLAVLLTMSAVFFLPKQIQEQPVGVKLELPETLGEWHGAEAKIGTRELEILGKETEFARKTYVNSHGDELFVTIVLSGHDMDVSIHRPERCLPAQGWSLDAGSVIKIAVPARGALDATRLKAIQMVKTNDGKPFPYSTLNYYWFTGYTDSTGSHLTRTLTDITDRLLHGYNQRWAYFTVAATITKDMQRNGRTEAETDAFIQDFIQRLVPETHLPSVKLGK